ncbi:MAG: HupE/UreJ family protein [Rhizobiaceae bacterium]|nr:HupE/UreJ family protein [Rhizobiaceae bacterium]
MPQRLGLAGLLLVAATSAASAHVGDDASGFVSGLLHPIFGWDHVVAMVAVGLWGAFLGVPAIYILPVVFPVVMALGGVLGMNGIDLPFVEAGIGASGLVLGLMVAFAVRLPIAIAMVIVGVFAVFHGHAHGMELPGTANPFGYAVGFVVSTSLLHLAGIGLGALTSLPSGAVVVRSLGGLIALVGAAFLFGVA